MTEHLAGFTNNTEKADVKVKLPEQRETNTQNYNGKQNYSENYDDNNGYGSIKCLGLT